MPENVLSPAERVESGLGVGNIFPMWTEAAPEGTDQLQPILLLKNVSFSLQPKFVFDVLRHQSRNINHYPSHLPSLRPYYAMMEEESMVMKISNR
jgi:hypothetical protein